ncbi:peptidylprolyl isomerase [Algivirga pacifica]|uniref:Peptidylprolyl isomerase n=1 Tax=Algivirga pacifica TaxID=1162670 RepID=A0ABP9DDG8_9BACT
MKYLISTFFLSVFLFGHSLLAQEQVVDKIVAKVDNHIILLSEVEAMYQQMLSNGEYPPNKEEAKCEILKSLIMNKVLYAKAEIDSIAVDDAGVEQEMDRRMQYMILQIGSQEKLEKTYGMSMGELRDDLREQVKEQMTVQNMQRQIINDVKITPKEIEKFYEAIPDSEVPFLSAEVQVGQIVLEPEVSKSEKEKVKEQLMQIKQRVLDGEDFATLAKQYSEDYGSGRKGGELGWHGRGELVPEFEEVALTIEEGEIANPVESEFGYHLIQLMERRGNRFNARHILIRPKSNSKDLEQAYAKADSVRGLILADSMTFPEAAQEFSVDQQTRANAGYFTNQLTGSSMVSTDELEPTVFFTIDTMTVGNITKPMQYRTAEGKEAVRILYYKDYKEPHTANLKDDFQKLYQLTLNARKNDILQEWVKKARKDVYVEIDDKFKGCAFIEEFKN